MANFELSYQKMLKLEFSSPKNALHKNPGEKGLTFMGIYQSAWPKWQGWSIVEAYLKEFSSLQEASARLYNNAEIKELVAKFYKEQFWDRARLDEVLPCSQAHLIFCFGVNVGLKVAIKKAQKIIGVSDDGIVGAKTIAALNGYSPLKFEEQYRRAFVDYYTRLATSNPKYRVFLTGWLNRVKNT